MKRMWVLTVVVGVACGTGPGSQGGGRQFSDDRPAWSPDGAALPLRAPDHAVARDRSAVLFDGVHVHNQRETDRQQTRAVQLPPASESFRRITLHLALRCPDHGCDYWDRRGRLAIIQNPGRPDEAAIELVRFMTPYRVGMDVSLDVTDLRPILTGPITARVFIDTWVHPGPEDVATGEDYGQGWLVDARLDFEAGAPERRAFAVIPLWGGLDGVVYGDPARPASLEKTVTIPDGVRSARLWSFVTGHGQANLDNCAEFCPKRHTFTVGARRVDRVVWRACGTPVTRDQRGNWWYDRAGWCPGDKVVPWAEEVGTGLTPGKPVTIRWEPEAYDNTCRAPAPAEGCRCSESSPCVYNGGSHTEPYYWITSALILYR